jgi:ribosomal protein S18 acetylase RimI-like enzyme
MNERSKSCFSIRYALSNDAHRIAELDYEAFSWSNTQEDEEIFRNRIIAYPTGCVVLELENVIIGYGTAEKWLTERDPEVGQDALSVHQPTGKIFCITAMAIQKDYQRCGLGSRILETLINIAKEEKCTCVILETGKPFWYERFSFETIGQRTQNNATMFIMTRRI